MSPDFDIDSLFDDTSADVAKQERDRRIRDAFRNTLFAPSPDCAIVRRALAEYCGVFVSTIRVGPGGTDVPATMMAEGRRDVWLIVHQTAGIDPTTGKQQERINE